MILRYILNVLSSLDLLIFYDSVKDEYSLAQSTWETGGNGRENPTRQKVCSVVCTSKDKKKKKKKNSGTIAPIINMAW